MDHREKVDMLKRLFWDHKVDPEKAILILEGKVERIDKINRNELFIKLLNYYPWHKVRKLVSSDLYKELLSEEVMKGLFPPLLRDRYRYVRELL
ncbi:MAG TPA: hypothetical protein PK185_15895 [Cyclobacteriaceae bacterium]|nr:hypothetical protein [Cyclobacteriaceae bacterium]HRK55399.1 hypothetical protein [Cyclobacteriaceae bacterium]